MHMVADIFINGAFKHFVWSSTWRFALFGLVIPLFYCSLAYRWLHKLCETRCPSCWKPVTSYEMLITIGKVLRRTYSRPISSITSYLTRVNKNVAVGHLRSSVIYGSKLIEKGHPRRKVLWSENAIYVVQALNSFTVFIKFPNIVLRFSKRRFDVRYHFSHLKHIPPQLKVVTEVRFTMREY